MLHRRELSEVRLGPRPFGTNRVVNVLGPRAGERGPDLLVAKLIAIPQKDVGHAWDLSRGRR
jgi:hypothetical protein